MAPEPRGNPGPTEIPMFSERFPADPELVPVARRALVEFAEVAGADPEEAEAIRLAASEVLTNAVIHGYAGAPGEIDVSAWVVAGELWMLIADDGRGVRAGTDSPGLGLGLGLIVHLSDGLAILERASGGTEVRIRFALAQAGLADAHRRGSLASARRPASSRFSTTR